MLPKNMYGIGIATPQRTIKGRYGLILLFKRNKKWMENSYQDAEADQQQKVEGPV